MSPCGPASSSCIAISWRWAICRLSASVSLSTSLAFCESSSRMSFSRLVTLGRGSEGASIFGANRSPSGVEPAASRLGEVPPDRAQQLVIHGQLVVHLLQGRLHGAIGFLLGVAGGGSHAKRHAVDRADAADLVPQSAVVQRLADGGHEVRVVGVAGHVHAGRQLEQEDLVGVDAPHAGVDLRQLHGVRHGGVGDDEDLASGQGQALRSGQADDAENHRRRDCVDASVHFLANDVSGMMKSR